MILYEALHDPSAHHELIDYELWTTGCAPSLSLHFAKPTPPTTLLRRIQLNYNESQPLRPASGATIIKALPKPTKACLRFTLYSDVPNALNTLVGCLRCVDLRPCHAPAHVIIIIIIIIQEKEANIYILCNAVTLPSNILQEGVREQKDQNAVAAAAAAANLLI